MKRLAAISCFLGLHISAVAADNLSPFTQSMPHPICGINPDFDGNPRDIPVPPFASCRSLAPGFGSEKSYSDPGTDALSKLIVALGTVGGGFTKQFGPLSQMPLECRPPLPQGMGRFPGPVSQLPVCTVEFLQSFLSRYNSQPVVKEFRRMETRLKQLDLSEASSINKLKQAEVVVRASGGNVTFDEIADLLK